MPGRAAYWAPRRGARRAAPPSRGRRRCAEWNSVAAAVLARDRRARRARCRSQRRGWLDVDGRVGRWTALSARRRWTLPAPTCRRKGPWATTAAHGFTRSRRRRPSSATRSRSANRTRAPARRCSTIGGRRRLDPRRRCGDGVDRSRATVSSRRCRPRCRHRQWWLPLRHDRGPHRAHTQHLPYAAYRAPVHRFAQVEGAMVSLRSALAAGAVPGPRAAAGRMPCRCTPR